MWENELLQENCTRNNRVMSTAGNQGKRRSWLPAAHDQDCPQHPRINQRRWTTVSSPERRRGGGEEGRTEMWHDMAVARVHERDAEKFERWILFLARECPLPFTSGPSPRQWTSNRSCFSSGLAPSSFRPSRPLSLYVCLSVCFSLPSDYSIFLSLTLFPPRSRSRTARKRERILLIYDKTEDLGNPVTRFPRRDLRNSSRRCETKEGEKERSAIGKYAIMLYTLS